MKAERRITRRQMGVAKDKDYTPSKNEKEDRNLYGGRRKRARGTSVLDSD